MEDLNNNYIKEKIIDRLKQTICMITFRKKDGTIRELKCTLNPLEIPTSEPTIQVDPSKPQKSKAKNPDVIPVYDVESKAWKSFRWDSMIEFRGTMNL